MRGTPMFPLSIDRAKPTYPQIIEGIIEKIRSGYLKPGNPVPGSRQLAQILKVNRNTITEAYSRLIAQGWLVSIEKKGTFVAKKKVAHKTMPISNEINGSFSFNDFSRFHDPQLLYSKNANRFWEVVIDEGYPDPELGPIKEYTSTYKSIHRMVRKKGNVYYPSDDVVGNLQCTVFGK